MRQGAPPADGTQSRDRDHFQSRRSGVDGEIARIADCQYGLVTLAQLRGLGISRSAVYQRARGGRLHRVHEGVYAVGYSQLTREGRWMAAVLAGGSDAVLSHRSAAALWGIRDVDRGSVDVTAPNRRGRQSAGHRCASLLVAGERLDDLAWNPVYDCGADAARFGSSHSDVAAEEGAC
jgi:Transcriptional regulator, AbiEi antitoxin